jgi:glycerol-3-phosphate dehydrogenase
VDAVKLVEEAGLKLTPKEDFEPCRKPMVRFRSLSHEERDRLIKENPAYGRIICRCESVTEGEIIDAVHRGARTLDGIKFRARAGAGRCQGGFCQPLVMAIIARELGIPLEEVTKRGLGSEPVMYHAKELLTGGEGQ